MRLLSLSLVLWLSLNHVYSETIKKLVIGIEGEYPPFNYVNSQGELEGFDVEIARLICQELKVEVCKLEQVKWESLIPSLLTKKIDIIVSSMSDNALRRKKIDFTQPYYNSPVSVFGKKQLSSQFTTVDSALKQAKIGVQSGTIHDQYMQKQYPQSRVVTYPTFDHLLLDLKANRVDYMVVDKLALTPALLKDLKQDYDFLGDIHDPVFFGAGLSIGLRKQDPLKPSLNRVIESMTHSEAYNNISIKYFGFVVTPHSQH